MLVEDFTLNKNDQGTEHITFEENPSKTRYVNLTFGFLLQQVLQKYLKTTFLWLSRVVYSIYDALHKKLWIMYTLT